MKYWLLVCAAITMGMSSCKSTVETTPLVLERVEKLFFNAKSPNDLKTIISQKPYLSQYFGASLQDSTFLNHLYSNISNQELRAFNTNLESVFGDMLDLKAQFEEAFATIKDTYPTFKSPKIATVVTGFLGNDLYVSDSIIVIGLDYFGGPKAKYRPQLYEYQLKRYQKEYIVASVLFFLAEKHNKIDPQDKTFLADMVAYGKAFEFVKHVAPNTPDSLIIGYSQKQLDDVYASQQDIWAYFLSRKILYQSRDVEKQPFFSERPATIEISQECPGAIGRWVGWRIVNKYLRENSRVSLKELMENSNTRQIFEQSNYRGEPDEE